MKKMRLLLFVLLSCSVFHSNAQTVDEIVDKNTEAMGGKEKLASLKTVKISATVSAQGNDIAITIIKSQMIGTRTEFDYNGTTYYQVANVKKGQMYSPGMPDPVDMDEDTHNFYMMQTDIQGPLFNYKEKGNKIELTGTEKVDGSEAYKLKVTFKSGKTADFFIDKKTNRLVKTKGTQTMMGQEMEIETTYTDYKQNADGYWFAYTATNSMRGPIKFDKIETNVPVDEKIFAN